VFAGQASPSEPRYPRYVGARRTMVARESIILAAREVIVLILVVAVLAWVGYEFLRDARR
jgi:hypothetical protein